MKFYNFKMMRVALCVILFPITLFAQTTHTTEQPDTSWFTDVTAQVGLNTTNIGAMIAVDVNNDDYPDLITISSTLSDTALRLWINEQNPDYPNDPTQRIFVDRTAGSGINNAGVLTGLGGAADFNNDGNVDLLVNTWYMDSSYNFDPSDPECPPNPDSGQNRLRILLGDGQGHFTLLDSSGLENIGANSGTGLPMLDYDRDGNLDLFVATLYHNWCYQQPFGTHLMKGDGTGHFTDVTASAGTQLSQQDPAKPWLSPPLKRAYFGANVSDWNNDCWPDIFACPYEAIGYPFDAVNNSYPTNQDTEDTRGYGNLYRNNGYSGNVGKFTDVGVTANWDPHFAWADQGMVPWAAMPADYNNDGNMDYLVILVHGANNPVEAQYNYPNFPGDGRSCIFTNLGPDSGYKLSPNVAQVTRNTPQNVTHGDHNGIWTDFNNDGWQDFVIGDAAYDEAPTYPDEQRMFFELQDTTTHQFRDITHDLGFITGTGEDSSYNTSILHKIRRPSVILPVDYDLDGDDDIFKCPYNPPGDSMLVLRNNVGNRNNHITIKLVAPSGVNKDCIGARIRVVAGNLKQMKDIYGDQGSQTNEYPFIQNFGLGQRKIIDTIDVRWPDNNCDHTILTNVPVNQFIKIDSAGYTSGIKPLGANMPNNFSLYPNPASTTINVRFKSQLSPIIELFNELGQQVADYQPGYSSSFILPIGNLPAGLYFVHVISGTNSSPLTKSFIKTANP